MAVLMANIQENVRLGELKVSRILKLSHNIHNVIEAMAEKLSLSIKNFETRSEAML